MIIDENDWVVIGFLIPHVYLLAWWYVEYNSNIASKLNMSLQRLANPIGCVIGYGKDLTPRHDDEINVD